MFYIRKIGLKNFRCFRKASFELDKNINIIIGSNAVGKTSLIESIYVSGCCKSHRTSTEADMIYKGELTYIIENEVCKEEQIDEIKIIYNSNGKKIIKNEKVCRSLSEYIGYFNVVMFCPEDLKLIKGEPSYRRRFLDIYISQIDKNYMMSLTKYKKILKQRNEYLKKETGVDKIMLKTYTDALIKEAKVIVEKRDIYINKLNEYFNDKIKVISGEKECGKIVYKPNTNVENLTREFDEKYQLDLISKTTNCGPHKDDFCIELNNEDSSRFASQGQQRTITLAIKLSQVEVIKEFSDNVVVLLDDVFGELDQERQNHLIKLINYDNQIIITTTSVENLSHDVLKDSKVIEINKEGGRI